jgi:hypothetical protein
MYNEQKETENFEKACGGRSKADQLFKIFQDSYPGHAYDVKKFHVREYSKTEVFKLRASKYGFTNTQIEMLLRLQGRHI